MDSPKSKFPLPQQDYMVVVKCFTYNHGKYIEDTLKGFVMQKTDFPFCALVVDDFSTDDTAQIVRRYEEQYPDIIKGVYLQENYYSQGGIKREKTEIVSPWFERCKYIAMCEGDDYWTDPQKLQRQVEFMESHSDYVLTYTDALVVDDDGRSIPHRTPRRYSGLITKELLSEGNFIVTASACFRNHYKDYNKEIANVPFRLMMGDKPMWIYYSTIGKIHYFKEKMVAYRVLSESASHSSDKNKLIAFNDNGEQITKYFNARYQVGLSEKYIEYRYAVSRVRAMAKISRRDFTDAWFHLIKKHPRVLLNVRLAAIAFIRIVLDRKV